MAIDTMRDLLIQQLRDLYSAEKQIMQALPNLVKSAANEELAVAFADHLTETAGHVQRLDEALTLLDVSSRGPRCQGIAGLLKEGDEMLDETGDPAAIDAGLVAGAQRVEHFEIAGYGTARAMAEALGLPEIARLLDATLDEEKAADERLTEIAEGHLYPQAISAIMLSSRSEGGQYHEN